MEDEKGCPQTHTLSLSVCLAPPGVVPCRLCCPFIQAERTSSGNGNDNSSGSNNSGSNSGGALGPALAETLDFIGESRVVFVGDFQLKHGVHWVGLGSSTRIHSHEVLVCGV